MKPTVIHDPLPFDESTTTSVVSTGRLPHADDVQALLVEAYEQYRHLDEGEIARFIPALAETPPDLFGAAMASNDGTVVEVGDVDYQFTIQSVSKPFVFALVCQTLGYDEARERLGVNSTGLPFNSVVAVELHDRRTMNPMVNAGAIAATSAVAGTTADEKWQNIVEGLSQFAGRDLTIDPAAYESETATNHRNRGIAYLLDSYGRLSFEPEASTDIYTKQCSLLVNVRDLAVMGATLADGGVNPLTRRRVIDEHLCKRVLSVLATAGLYELSGDWLYEVGLPGKSGVSGGIVTVAPGKGGLGVFSPRLDVAGNSVRGQHLTKHVSERLGLNLFASRPWA